ncbi:hypothetical protein PVAP13_4KG185500 [Panicum virgatum]|uniref:Uncharacterized protein n=1 Tax=Panicum virgatum TaxID=38727 RepID=A0A8T0THF5_PANVG|nr:hypothetical protein PVAP13_4KG185500 [Panicum virgatum]
MEDLEQSIGNWNAARVRYKDGQNRQSFLTYNQELETANKMSYMEKQKELQDGNGQLNNFNSQQQQIQAMHTVAVYNAQASQTERVILNAEMRGHQVKME